MSAPPKYITTHELRAILGCSETTLRRWRKELTDFPSPVRISRSPTAPMRWVESDVYTWLENQRGGVA
jgi:predicted DNA-binding transcriptional regulator AlpA